jgi:hypothetical protein
LIRSWYLNSLMQVSRNQILAPPTEPMHPKPCVNIRGYFNPPYSGQSASTTCILTFLSYKFIHTHIQASHDESLKFSKSVNKTDDNGKCFNLSRVLMLPNLQKNTKSWRKIFMTKPGFEPRNIEMEVGRSVTYTIRTPMIPIFADSKIFSHG